MRGPRPYRRSRGGAAWSTARRPSIDPRCAQVHVSSRLCAIRARPTHASTLDGARGSTCCGRAWWRRAGHAHSHLLERTSRSSASTSLHLRSRRKMASSLTHSSCAVRSSDASADSRRSQACDSSLCVRKQRALAREPWPAWLRVGAAPATMPAATHGRPRTRCRCDARCSAASASCTRPSWRCSSSTSATFWSSATDGPPAPSCCRWSSMCRSCCCARVSALRALDTAASRRAFSASQAVRAWSCARWSSWRCESSDSRLLMRSRCCCS